MTEIKINIKSVAAKSGVSTATVSRVVNKSGYVSDKTEKKVLKTIRKLGYRHNILASNLRRKSTSYIGLIVPSIHYEFFASLAKSLETALQKENLSLFLCNSDGDFEKEKIYIDSLVNNQASGLVLVSSDFEKCWPFIREQSLPAVLIDRFDDSVQKEERVVCLTSDNFEGGKVAGNQLLASRAKKIVFLMTDKKTQPQVLREDGFITSMSRNGVSKKNFRICKTKTDPVSVANKIKEIRKEFKFDGIFCGNDRVAFGALYALLDSRVKVPEEVQVIGFDDIEIGRYLKPALSTIKQDVEQIGEIAAKKIVDMVVSEKKLNEKIVIPVKYIKRDTTK